MPLEKTGIRSAVLRDGFLRIALNDLLSANLTHLISGLDDDHPLGPPHCGATTSITGYTEWIGEGPGVGISLGWDWRLEKHDRGDVTCVRIGLPRSNVMLVDTANQDFGWNRNLEVLATVIDAMPWADQTQLALQCR